MADSRRFAAWALPLFLTACYDDDDDDCGSCDDLVVYESEINDSSAQADWIGVVYPGQALSIRGHVTKSGPDLFDGFAFVTGAPLQIDVSLWADAWGADLDLCVWDPVFGQYVTCFETAAQPESGSFLVLEAGKEIHLVVRSFAGDSAYWLDVAGAAADYGLQAAQIGIPERAPGVWDDYGPVSTSAETEPGREALWLEIAADGSLFAAAPARVVLLSDGAGER